MASRAELSALRVRIEAHWNELEGMGYHPHRSTAAAERSAIERALREINASLSSTVNLYRTTRQRNEEALVNLIAAGTDLSHLDGDVAVHLAQLQVK